jgi:hypothetical protein
MEVGLRRIWFAEKHFLLRIAVSGLRIWEPHFQVAIHNLQSEIDPGGTPRGFAMGVALEGAVVIRPRPSKTQGAPPEFD